MGSENVEVVQYMLAVQREVRGSALVGKSVHDQRYRMTLEGCVQGCSECLL